MVERFGACGGRVVAIVMSDEEASRVPVSSSPPGAVSVKDADLTTEPGAVACSREIERDLGGIDALVHTVGMWSGGPFLETTQKEWDLMARVNLTSAFLCFREAARLMQSSGGTLIGIASRQGADQGVAEQAAYSAAKAGVVRLVESVAAEFTDVGIACHAIAPSTILFDETGEGVRSEEIIDLAMYLIDCGSALSGSTLRAYGS